MRVTRYNDKTRADGEEFQRLYRFTYSARSEGEFSINVLARDYDQAMKTYVKFLREIESGEPTKEEIDRAMSSLRKGEYLEGELLIAD